jgi:IPT/TIG domain-containing protein
MFDAYVLLAPVLLLGMVALLGLVGCLSKPSPQFPPTPTITPPLQPQWGSPAGGDVVKITGTKFGTSDTVTFGGVAVDTTHLTISDTEIDVSATPPHSPGAVDVVVTPMAGDPATAPQAFTYGVAHQATSQASGTGISVLQLSPLQGSLVIVTAVWSGAATLSFITNPAGTAFTLANQSDLAPQNIHVAVYSANNLSNAIAIKGALTGGTSNFSLVASAYDFADPNLGLTPDQFTSQQGLGSSVGVPLQISDFAPGDLIYGVAAARNATGGLAGGLSPGGNPPMIQRTIVGMVPSYLMVEDHVVLPEEITPPFNVTATATDPMGQWYVFAMRVRVAPA